MPSLLRRSCSELLSTTLLLAIVVGSGIMGQQLAVGNTAVALLANSVATGAGLIALILTFGGVSCHMNQVVTLVAAMERKLPWLDAAVYMAAQMAGAAGGVMLAHAMFAQPLLQHSLHVRTGLGQLLAETVATFGLLLVVLACAEKRLEATPYAVGAYITSAYWFTASTSFANPGVTLARSLTSTFAGIRPADVLPFCGAQVIGAVLGFAVYRLLLSSQIDRNS